MPTKPQSNLPPQAQPWGRYVEESLANLERGTSINGQNSNNNLRQLNSSVQLLSQQQQDLKSQQDYLSGLKTYTAQEATWPYTSNTTETLIKTISLSFTLDRTSTVATYATATANGAVQATTPLISVSDTAAWARCDLVIDSLPTIYGGFRGQRIREYETPSSFTSFVRNEFYVDANIDNVTVLGPGSHTITAKWSGYIGTSSAGYMQIYPAVLVSSIIS